jgi:hypothetical protein
MYPVTDNLELCEQNRVLLLQDKLGMLLKRKMFLSILTALG